MNNLRKLLAYMLLGLVAITISCDKDDDKEKTVLVSKLTMNYGDDTEIEIIDIVYNSDNKVAKITNNYTTEDHSETSVSTFTYDNDVILEVGTSDGEESDKITYTKADNKYTIEYMYKEEGEWVLRYKDVYTLDSDGLVSSLEEYQKIGDDIWNQDYMSTFSWTGGNIDQRQFFYVTDSRKGALARIHTKINPHLKVTTHKSVDDERYMTQNYKYDDKMNPFQPFGLIYGIGAQNKNNVTEMSYVYDNTDWGPGMTYNYEYEYDSKGYPVKQTFSYTYDGEEYSYVTLIEYIEK